MTRQLHLALLLAAALPLAAHAAIPLDACDSPSFQAVQHASPSRLEARALWLDRRLAKWPGAVAEGSFRLYYSPVASISAPLNARVSGAAGGLALDVFAGGLPAPAAARFKHLSDGPVLAVKDADIARLPDLHRQQLVLVREAPDGSVLAATRLQAAGALDDIYAVAADVQGLA
jgi:pullulanase